MILLDLYCGAGGTGRGFHNAGFEIVGVDSNPQPNYPYEFIQEDALEYLTNNKRGFHAIAAGPPCQKYTRMKNQGRGRDDHPALIAPTRDLLDQMGLPYVIENVEGAKAELHNPIRLCGSMFGLPVQRHRLFETNWPLTAPECQHWIWTEYKYPATPWRPGQTSRTGLVVNPMASGTSHRLFADAMQIDWVTPRGFRPTKDLQQAIPPAYTEYIGRELMKLLSPEPTEE